MNMSVGKAVIAGLMAAGGCILTAASGLMDLSRKDKETTTEVEPETTVNTGEDNEVLTGEVETETES